MADITGTYRNTHIVPIARAPLNEAHLELDREEGSGSNSPSTSTHTFTQSRTDSHNNIYIGESETSAFIEQQEDSRKKCMKVLTLKLTEKLQPTTITYTKLESIYRIDKLARQKFYQAVRKSGAKGLYLDTKLNPKYQTKTYLLTIEQDTGKFFLDTPFGRRSIISPKNVVKLFDNCCISKQETIRAAFRILLHVIESIFTPHRVDKVDPFLRLEDYLDKKWHRVNLDPLNEIDERLGVHYNPIKNTSPSKKFEYSDSPLLTNFQIQDIERRLRDRKKS